MYQFPPKKILVAMDLSEASFSAWLHAHDLAGRFGAALEAVYVDSILPSGLAEEPLRPLSRELREEIVSQIRRRIGDVGRVEVIQGDPVITLLRLARAKRADLIVMGTHGRTGLSRVLMGSVAEAVVRRSPVPVLTVHSNPRPLKGVLAPVNFTPYAEAGLAFAAEAAAALGARLTALHVALDLKEGPNPRFLLTSMIQRLDPSVRAVSRPQVAVRAGEAAKEILAAAPRYGWVVLVAHRKSLFQDLVLGTTAERVLRHAVVPVLSIPSPGARSIVYRRPAGRPVPLLAKAGG